VQKTAGGRQCQVPREGKAKSFNFHAGGGNNQ